MIVKVDDDGTATLRYFNDGERTSGIVCDIGYTDEAPGTPAAAGKWSKKR
jgi:hypothetical protein